MNRLPQRELFTSERPVRSDYARELSYARRRTITVLVSALVVGAGVYAFWGRPEPTPAEIPTIKSDGVYKQKPADPGGIDIPNQDVRVYEELEGKGLPRVEHLMPPPETPKEARQPDATALPDVGATAPVPAAAPVATVTPSPQPQQGDVLQNASAIKPVETTVEKAPPPPEASAPPVALTPQNAPVAVAPNSLAAPKKEIGSLDELLKRINANETNAAPVPTAKEPPVALASTAKEPVAALAPAAKEPAAPSAITEKSAVQLASLPNEAQAQELMATLQKKYADQLGNAKLHLARADLGSKGIYYRIQSETLVKDEANRICLSLKKLNAGCILVGK